MNIVSKSADRVLISISTADLLAISNALNEICNGVHIADTEFQTRLGVSRAQALSTLSRVLAAHDAPETDMEVCTAWEDHGGVMVKAITVHGDPAELGEAEAREFIQTVAAAVRKAT
jgi:hypothetical protein